VDVPLSPKVKAGGVAVLVLLGLGCAVLVSALGDHGTAVPVAKPTATAAASGGPEIYVHILGAVARPGLYELREGDRAIDAVAAAGGFAETADQAQLNLARFVVDGEQIVVPNVGETLAAASGVSASGLVNINSADAATLDTLPRVGPAMAARIIEWREANGPFTAIEDLMNVTGIGEKTFDGLNSLITI
jgi:competence protein ComEA